MNNKLKLTERLSFGLGEIPGAISGIFGAFLMMFYTDNVGMAAGALGTMFFISRLLDGVTDLIAGTLIDKTRTKWGKARPWLLWLSIPTGLSVALVFMVPEGSSAVKMVYAFITYNLFMSIMYTVVGVAKNAMMALMTQNPLERGNLAKYSMIFGLGGSVIGFSITLPFVYKLGGDVSAWKTVFIVYGVITTLSLLASFFMSKEYVKPVNETAHGERMSFKEGVKCFVHNKYFLLTLFITVAVNYSVQVNSGAQIYFYTYNMKNPLLMTTLSLAGLVPTVLGIVFLSGPSLKYFGKKKSIYIGAAGQIAGYALRGLSVATMNIPMLFAGTIICGLFVGPISVPVNTLAADAVDFGELKTGKRIEGIGGGIVTFSQKISTGFATASIGWILALTGYVANAEVQSAATTFGITGVFAYLPIIFLMLTIAGVKFFYNYEEDFSKEKESYGKRTEKKNGSSVELA